MPRPFCNERVLWRPGRRVLGLPAGWVALVCALVVLTALIAKPLLIRRVPTSPFMPMFTVTSVPSGVDWPLVQSHAMSRNEVSLTYTRTCIAASPTRLGFLRTSVLATIEATLATPSGTWRAPPGTTDEQIAAKADAAGMRVDDSVFWMPPGTAERFYGLPPSARPAVGTYKTIIPAAIAYDILHLLLILATPFLLVAAPGLVFTTRDERRALRASLGRCQSCRYQRGDIPAPSPCPECGAPAPA